MTLCWMLYSPFYGALWMLSCLFGALMARRLYREVDLSRPEVPFFGTSIDPNALRLPGAGMGHGSSPRSSPMAKRRTDMAERRSSTGVHNAFSGRGRPSDDLYDPRLGTGNTLPGAGGAALL